MTRVERIAPFLEALSDEEFEALLASASYAACDRTIYETLTPAQKADINDAIARLEAGSGIDVANVRARLKAKLLSART